MKFLALTLALLAAVALTTEGRSINGLSNTRDLKSTLIAKGNKLIAEADAAFKKLSGAEKAAEAAIVKSEEAAVKKLIAELEAATEPAALTKIEAELNKAEQKLAAEVAKLEKEAAPKTPVTRDLKSDLIAKGQALIKQADAEVQKLTGLQRAAEARIVKAEEDAIRRLITELEAATEQAAIARIERELTVAEARLAQEIAKISGTPAVVPGGDDKKAALIAKGQALIKEADAAVAKLTGLQRVTEAGIVRAEEQAIRRLITELEAATGETAVARIEAELTRAEARLAAEVAKISGTPAVVPAPGADQKAALIAKGQALIKEADAAVAKLTGAARAAEAAIVRAEEQAIRRLITELEAATGEGSILRLEGELNRAEQRLAAEIAKIGKIETPVVPAPVVTRDLKSSLIAKGEALLKEADAAFKKLSTAQKAAEAAVVKSEEAAVKKLIAELEAATEAAVLTKIEAELKQAESKLAAEVAKLEKEVKEAPKTPVTRDLKSDLIAKGTKLIADADAAVQKLTGAQKAAEAAIVKTEEARIKSLVAQLEAATTVGLTRLEGELSRAEQKLAYEIQKIEKEAKTPVVPANPIPL